jgi:hemerythrin-like domain-containing protein
MATADVLSLLRADHRAVKDLLGKLDKTTERGAATRTRLLDKIARELKAHTTAEEETFYQPFRDAVESEKGEEIYYEANEEHHVVDLVLPEILATDPASPVFAAKAAVLKELVEHHIKEEEKEMFKKARAAFSRDELLEMGKAFAARKREVLKKL